MMKTETGHADQEVLAGAPVTTNWVTSQSGSVAASAVRVYPGTGDGVYEIEYSGEMLGLTIGTKTSSSYAFIQSVSLR